jgi:hypothetical protein
MASEIYRHPSPRTPLERGHDEKCEFTDNMGESCDCEHDLGPYQAPNAYALPNAMQLLGWKAQDKARPNKGWTKVYGHHIIMLSRVKSGWQYKWYSHQMTMMSSPKFGTVPAALDHLWGTLAERIDESAKAFWDNGAMRSQLQTAGIVPRELGVKPPPAAVPGPLKHEVTDIMDQKGRE